MSKDKGESSNRQLHRLLTIKKNLLDSITMLSDTDHINRPTGHPVWTSLDHMSPMDDREDQVRDYRTDHSHATLPSRSPTKNFVTTDWRLFHHSHHPLGGAGYHQNHHPLGGVGCHQRTGAETNAETNFYNGRRNTDHVLSMRPGLVPDDHNLLNTWPRANMCACTSDHCGMNSDANVSYIGGNKKPGLEGSHDSFLLGIHPNTRRDIVQHYFPAPAIEVPRSHWRQSRHNKDGGGLGAKGHRKFTNPNADIIRYLNQFNDKVAFNAHATFPTRHSFLVPTQYASPLARVKQQTFENRVNDQQPFKYAEQHQSRVGYQSHATESEKLTHPIQCSQSEWSLDRQHQRLRDETPLCKDGIDSSGLSTCTRDPNTETVRICIDGTDRQREPYEQSSLPRKQERELINHYMDQESKERRRSRGNSGSLFSSDTDSDFIFYPCSSIGEALKALTLADHCDPHTVSEIPSNSKVSWRSDLRGSSLDDVTKQFFLDEDALSDDVFADEPSLEDDVFEDDPITFSDQIVSDRNTTQQGVDLGQPSKSEETQVACDKSSSMGQVSLHSAQQSSEEEYVLLSEEVCPGLSGELANTFDSLRRNSTQSKSRRLWKQRRDAKSKKIERRNKLKEPKIHPAQKVSSIRPEVFTFETKSNNARDEAVPSKKKPPPKPLRGILKNKTYIPCAQTKSSTKPGTEKHGSPRSHTLSLPRTSDDDIQGESLARGHDQVDRRTTPETDLNTLQNSILSNQEDFDFYVTSSGTGEDEIIAVRKNSLETYKWTRSLLKRQKFKERSKDGGRTKGNNLAEQQQEISMSEASTAVVTL